MTGLRRGRNQLCPCGSGRKVKRCCGIVSPSVLPLEPSWRAGFRHGSTTSPGSGDNPRQHAVPRAVALVADGQRLVQQAQTVASIPLFKEAVRLDPGNVDAYYGLGTAYLERKLLPQAQTCFYQATVLRPDFAPAHFNLAITFDLQGMAEPAIKSYRAAVAHAPADPGAHDKLAFAHDRLADLLLSAGRDAEAAESYRAVIATSPDTLIAWLSEARLFMIEQDWAAATAAARRATDAAPACGAAWELFGSVSAITGDFDEAVACFRRAVAVDPRYAPAWLSLVSVRRITRDDATIISGIETVLPDQTLADPERAMLHFALGKAMDDLGDYEGAMRQFDMANRIRGAHLLYDAQYVKRHVDRMIATFTRSYFTEHRDVATPDRRPIFILGMPRSGTTLVEQIISSHPDVAAGGELSFWGDHAATWEGDAVRIAGDYRALLNSISSDAARITDKMPLNFLWAGMIHTIFPNATILHCQRNAIDVCMSIYTNYFRRPMPFVAERGNLTHFYQQYLRLMDHWRVVLPSDRLLDIDYGALVRNPEVVTRQIIAFCGLRWADVCVYPELNNRPVRTASVWQVRQPINRSRLDRWRRYEPWLGALRELLAHDADNVPCDAAPQLPAQETDTNPR